LEKEGRVKKLERKIIDVIDSKGKFIGKGKVVGCDYDVGITIVDKDNPNVYFGCLAGPSSTLWNIHYSEELYKALFDSIVNQIKSGILSYKAMDHVEKIHNMAPGYNASAEHCPFGQ